MKDVALAAEEEQQTKVRSTPAIRKHQYPQPPGLDLDSYFDDGLFYGVASVQVSPTSFSKNQELSMRFFTKVHNCGLVRNGKIN